MTHVFRTRWLPPFLGMALLILLPAQTFSQNTQPDLRIGAKSAVLMDALTGQVLYEQDPQLKTGPASFSKIVTLYLAFDAIRNGQLKKDDLVTISKKAWQTGGSKMFLKVGERVTVEELLKGIAIVSGNDACVALAEHLTGSEDIFVVKMNEKATLLGLKNSQFKNSHGLPAEDQYTTASDVAILAWRYIQDHPEALLLHAMTNFEHNGIRQQNRNPLLSREMGVDGLMTGHVEKWGYHFAATAKRGQRRMIAVVMGSASSRSRAKEAEILLTHGFKNFVLVEAVKEGTTFGPVSVRQGKVGKLPLIAAEAVRVTVPKGKEETTTVTTNLPDYVQAPVQKGQIIGKVVIQSEGAILREVNLLAPEDVPKGFLFLTPLIAGGLLGLVLVSLIAFLRRRAQRKRFLSR
jgi:D-alanyl-D-alanine carboxypeptidase (penicillin-binding protein 5/6)